MVNTFNESGFWNKSITGSKSGLEGVLYKCKAEHNTPIKFGKNQELPTELKKIKDIETKICDISGSWMSQLSFDKQ